MAAYLFGIPVGLLGLAGAWHVGARIWNLPSFVADGISVAGGIVWLVLLMLYAHKWYRHRPKAKQEARDPVQSSFVSLGLISTMLVANAVLQLSRPLAVALFAAALASQLALGAWLLGRAWQGGQGDSVTPLPAALRAAMGIQLAPPVVGGAAYLSLTMGTPDLVANMLFGYGLYQAVLLLRLWRWIRLPAFSAGYWSVSFGATALPTMAMRMVQRDDSGPIAWVAPVVFVGANLVIAALALSSLRLLMRRWPALAASV